MTFAAENLHEIQQLFHLNKDGNLSNASNSAAGNGCKTNNVSNTKTKVVSRQKQIDINTEYAVISSKDLTVLTPALRNAFMIIVILLFVLSMLGNTCSLYVNLHRKIRPFFRACLLSLACSDIMNTIFLTVAYMSQFTSDYVQIWRLGTMMCGFVPFATTTAILASSMTLVGIGLDRYFAVVQPIISCWSPDVLFCIICIFLIWVAAVGIASPVFCIYKTLPVYILTEDNRTKNKINPTAANNTSFVQRYEKELVNMCISGTEDVTIYYVVVFVIIFIPSIIAFIWLNSVIARKLWIRRHRVCTKTPNSKTLYKASHEQDITNETKNLPAPSNPNIECTECHKQQSSTTMSSSFLLTLAGRIATIPIKVVNTTKVQQQQQQQHHPQCQNTEEAPVSSNNRSTNPNANSNAQNQREARHIRMVIIIIIMMAVFIFLRLPAWVFLIMRIYGSYSRTCDWILYFTFGILNLTSCCLNPIFYTFLTQTIQYFVRIKEKFINSFCCCLCCWRKGHRRYPNPNQNQKTELPATIQTTNLPTEVAPQTTTLAKYCCCCYGDAGRSFPTTKLICLQSNEKKSNEIVTHINKQQMTPSTSDPIIVQYAATTSLNNKTYDGNGRGGGIKCSAANDDSFNDLNHQRIHTIFQPSISSDTN